MSGDLTCEAPACAHEGHAELLAGKLQAIFDHAFCGMLILDDQQTILESNPAACALLVVSRNGLLGQHINEVSTPVLPTDCADWETAWNRFVEDGSFKGERIIHHADGTERRIFCHSTANIQPGQHLCVLLDVTQLRQSEQTVAQTEQLYRTLVETTNTGYCVLDAHGAIVDANAAYLRLTGGTQLEDIRGQTVSEWTASNDVARHLEAVSHCVKEGSIRDLELDYINSAGHITPVEINARRIQTESGALLLAMVRDITERKLVRQELQSAHAELEFRVRERTAELARANAQIRHRALQQEAVAAFGHQALMGSTLDTLLQEAAELVVATLDIAVACVMEHRSGTEEFVLRACAGWNDAPVGCRASYAGKNTQAGRVMATRQPLIVGDLVADPSMVAVFDGHPQPFRSGMTVLISGEDAPFGVLMAHSLNRREFSQDDVHFLQSMANILAAAIERKHGEQALQIAQQTAVRANNAKSDFLSRMSHELRTPLNAILGFGQLLEIERLSGNQQESVDQIVRAGRHLLNLVNEVLDISRIETGQLALASEPVPAAGLLTEALDLMRPLAAERGISVSVRPEIANGGYHVLADRQRLRQVFINLLSNAIKYNRLGGTVIIGGGLTLDGDRLRIEVRDTGIGMSPAQVALLFRPFERLGAEYSGIEGNGMGLALCERLIESQRGKIGALSKVNVGSTFWIELPISAAVDEPTLSVALLEEIFAQSSILQEDEEAELIPMSSAKDHSAKKQVVLHIEDNESNRRLVEMLLVQRPNLRLVSAARGEEGLELAREHHPALILLDMHLPDTTGENVLSHLRSEDATRETPVVVVSADATSARSNKLRAAGANDYLTKPFNVVQFLKVLDDYLLEGKGSRK